MPVCLTVMSKDEQVMESDRKIALELEDKCNN